MGQKSRSGTVLIKLNVVVPVNNIFKVKKHVFQRYQHTVQDSFFVVICAGPGLVSSSLQFAGLVCFSSDLTCAWLKLLLTEPGTFAWEPQNPSTKYWAECWRARPSNGDIAKQDCINVGELRKNDARYASTCFASRTGTAKVSCLFKSNVGLHLETKRSYAFEHDRIRDTLLDRSQVPKHFGWLAHHCKALLRLAQCRIFDCRAQEPLLSANVYTLR